MKPIQVFGRAVACAVLLALTAVGCSTDDDSDDAGGGGDPSDESVDTTPRLETLDGAPTPAPDEYDRISVVEIGAEDAENVLVLSPGTSAGAGYFVPLAVAIVEADPSWQVWAVDRRENLLEDHSVLAEYAAGDATPQEVFDYYLAWLNDPSITTHFTPRTAEDAAFAREWGMAVAVDDLRIVVEAAKEAGGEVVLGGHSLGGTITTAYASWDFDGTAGVDDLDGLVYIDGGSRPDSAMAEADVQAELTSIATDTPFNDLVGLGIPWAAGVFNSLGAGAALHDPDAPNLAYAFPLLPASLKPPVAPSNAGQYGFALDSETSPENLELIHLSMGHLADSGDPRGWVDDARLPVARAAETFAPRADVAGVDGSEWYFPRRLSLDGRTVNGGIANPSQQLVGVRAVHGDEIDVPIFTLETALGNGGVNSAAKSLAEQSGLDPDEVTAVEAHDLTHTDPMVLVPDQNPLVSGLVPFLRSIA